VVHILIFVRTLCRAVSREAFKDGMYQWAATLTSSGQNMPFALPLQADKTEDGFNITFIRMIDGKIIRQACISCSVESVAKVHPRCRDSIAHQCCLFIGVLPLSLIKHF
jgi:hypothetical protein